MAITYPLSFPSTPSFKRMRLGTISIVGVSQSIFTAEVQTQAHEGQLWRASMVLPPMKRAVAEEWIAFLVSLNGREGTFKLGDVLGTSPRGTGLGTPVVDGGSQTGQELATRGWTDGVVLKAGDYIQLGTTIPRLHKILQDATASGGDVTLDIWPRLRSSPSDGATVIISNTLGTFRLPTNRTQWDLQLAEFYGIVFSAIEAI